MDYFTDLLATFLDVDRGNIIAVYGRSESSQISHILICVPNGERRSYGFGTT